MKFLINSIFKINYKYIVFSILLLSLVIAQTVTNPITGRVWMDRNLGASQVANSITDAVIHNINFYSLYQLRFELRQNLH